MDEPATALLRLVQVFCLFAKTYAPYDTHPPYYRRLSQAKGDSDFAMGWPAQFAKTLREIRNGLSHAKENRMEKGIPPTKENLRKLQAWTTLVSVAATEAMLYRAEALP